MVIDGKASEKQQRLDSLRRPARTGSNVSRIGERDSWRVRNARGREQDARQTQGGGGIRG